MKLSIPNGAPSEEWSKKSADSVIAALKKSLSIKNRQQSNFANAICTLLISAYSDIYGDKTQDKYKKIVDLIIERSKDAICSTMTDIVDDNIDDSLSEVKELLKTKFPAVLSNKDIEKIILSVNGLIEESFELRKKQLLCDVTIAFADVADADSKSKDSNKEESNKDAAKEDKVDYNEVVDLINVSEIADKVNDYIFLSFAAIHRSTKIVNKIHETVKKALSSTILKLFDQFKKLKDNFDDINNKISATIDSTVEALTPNKKLKKAQAVFKRVINTISGVIDMLNNLTHKIVDMFIDAVDDFLFASIKVISKFVLKLLLVVVVPIALVIGGMLLLIADPLVKLLKPLIDIAVGLIIGIVDIIITILLAILSPLIHFILDVLREPLKIFLDACADALVAIVNKFSDFIVVLMPKMVTFVTECVQVLTEFIAGWATRAFDIGEKLSKFVLTCVSVIIEMLSGITILDAKDIGVSVATFALEVVGVLADFFNGFKMVAFDIGKEIGEFAVNTVDVLKSFVLGFNTCAEEFGKTLADFAMDIAEFIPELVKFLANGLELFLEVSFIALDFFDGMSGDGNLYDIGLEFGKFMLEMSNIRLAYIKEYKKYASKIGRIFADNLMPLLSKIKSGLTQLANIVGSTPADIGDNLHEMHFFLEKLNDIAECIDSMQASNYSFDTLWDITDGIMTKFDKCDDFTSDLYSKVKDKGNNAIGDGHVWKDYDTMLVPIKKVFLFEKLVNLRYTIFNDIIDKICNLLSIKDNSKPFGKIHIALEETKDFNILNTDNIDTFGTVTEDTSDEDEKDYLIEIISILRNSNESLDTNLSNYATFATNVINRYDSILTKINK